MPEFTAFLIAVGPMALAVTKAVDFVRSFDTDDAWWSGWWIVLATVFGVALAVVTELNLTALISNISPGVAEHLTGTLGQVITGVAIGATASAWHNSMAARTRATS